MDDAEQQGAPALHLGADDDLAVLRADVRQSLMVDIGHPMQETLLSFFPPCVPMQTRAANRDLPHLRHLCMVHPHSKAPAASNAQACPNCYCWVCDKPQRLCTNWGNGLLRTHHCNAYPGNAEYEAIRSKGRAPAPAPAPAQATAAAPAAAAAAAAAAGTVAARGAGTPGRLRNPSHGSQHQQQHTGRAGGVNPFRLGPLVAPARPADPAPAPAAAPQEPQLQRMGAFDVAATVFEARRRLLLPPGVAGGARVPGPRDVVQGLPLAAAPAAALSLPTCSPPFVAPAASGPLRHAL